MSAPMFMKVHSVRVNRAPVLTLWAAIVAEHLGFARDEALTLGRVVAGLAAYSKGKARDPDTGRHPRLSNGNPVSPEAVHRRWRRRMTS